MPASRESFAGVAASDSVSQMFDAAASPSAHDRTSCGGPVVAVLTAAGSGSRLGSKLPKALAPVGGRPLVRLAAEALLASGLLDLVVVTAPAESIAAFEAALEGVPTCVVVAGSPASRQASVALGLHYAMTQLPDAAVVLVHDAARALTPPEVVVRVVEAVRSGHCAVVPALPLTDTVKEVAAGESTGVEQVIGTPDRSRLRAVQTPQGFDAATLLRAHEAGAARAQDEAVAASDDAGLVEALGLPVVLVSGDEHAFKVTRPLDLALARLLVEGEAS